MTTEFIFRELANILNRQYGIATFKPLQDEGSDGISMLGTRIFGIFIFEKTAYDYLGTTFETPELKLPATILSVSYQNNIVQTALKGRIGTIKEYISTSDYSITLDSLLVSPDYTYPNNLLESINKIATAKNKIKIANEFLNALDIFDVVIKTFQVAQIKGTKNTLQLSMEMVSDLSEL